MAALPLYTPSAAADNPGNCTSDCIAGSEKSSRSSGVRYGAMNWIGEFRLPPQTAIRRGAMVVIQSDRGIEIGEQVSLTCPACYQSVGCDRIKEYIDNSGPEFYRVKAGKVLREASVQDIDEHERLNRHIREDVERCGQLAAQFQLDMKVITAEHLLGGERIVFYFRSDGRVDFRELVWALAQHYQTRIEMRQVGARDEARLIADYEVCGRECCCKNFLKKLRPVTMRMAKLQKSTLDPSKVSGRCGRLRCCLRYEHVGYDELARKLPRTGARVQTEIGPATVIDCQILTQLVLVRSDDERELAVPVEEISRLRAPAATPTAPAPDADRPAAGADADPQATDEQEESPRQRHRSHRQPRSSDDDQDPSSSEAVRPETPASEAPAALPEIDQPPDAAAKEHGEAERGGRPARRRRRRRRPRRDQSGSAPGAAES
ncbi:MAG: stage 0 sporulation family protein [Phycisphaerae bacterium]